MQPADEIFYTETEPDTRNDNSQIRELAGKARGSRAIDPNDLTPLDEL